jgi:hypothetical protein
MNSVTVDWKVPKEASSAAKLGMLRTEMEVEFRK